MVSLEVEHAGLRKEGHGKWFSAFMVSQLTLLLCRLFLFLLLTVYSLCALVSYSMLKQFYPLPLSMLEYRKKSLPSANLKTMALAVYLQI